ncbi:MAG: type II secretion system F family protein [bacterium]|nr:type II secretion system F family protein [bacterium]
MPIFKYKAKNSDNEVKEGMVDAATEQWATEALRDQGLSVVSISIAKVGGLGSVALSRVKAKDVVIFSRQFAVMISASIPIVQALKTLVGQTESPKFKMMISEIADEVNAGSRLSESLAQRPKVFDLFFISVIRAGETSGKLDEVLNYLADEMEKDYDLTHKIKGAMIYPIFVIFAMMVVGTVMMVWVVPKMIDVITESGGELPFATKVLIFVSDALVNYWYLLIGGVVAIFFAIKYARRFPAGRRYFDLIKLRLPIFGPLFQKIALVRFTRSLQTLIAGGVPISSGLKISADVVNNAIYQELILQTRKEVESGNTISSVFMRHKEVPIMVSQMFAVGEKTGKLDLVLDKITSFYSREIENVVANLVTLIEPLIMVAMGVAVGFMVAAIIMPMYNMASNFS